MGASPAEGANTILATRPEKETEAATQTLKSKKPTEAGGLRSTGLQANSSVGQRRTRLYSSPCVEATGLKIYFRGYVMAASTNTLSPKDQERLDTFAVEIAEERFGPFEEEGEGHWRLSSNRSILIHPGAIVFNFATQSCSHGVLEMFEREAGMPPAEAMKFARKWLAEHAGEGRLAPDDLDRGPGREARARGRQAHRRSSDHGRAARHSRGTPVDLYLASRGLQADDSAAGWIEPPRPGAYGEMITAATDEKGNVLAIQLTRLTPDGGKAAIKCPRITLRGPHDWSSRAVLRLNCDDGPIDTLHLVEGFEDGLSLVAAGVRNIWVFWGLGRLAAH